MPSEVILPRVDMDMATGKIAKWFVENGASVTKGQPLFEIETDKAAMEIEAPASGTIRDLAAASDSDIPVGSVVAWIFGEGEAAAPTIPTQPARSVIAASVPLRPVAGAAAVPVHAFPAEKPRATPMARRLARTGGVDLATLAGSGPRGRIQAADVVAACAPQPATAAVAQHAPAKMPSVDLALTSKPPVMMDASAGALNMVSLREGMGLPTLLIHGFGADANTWRPMVAGRGSERPILALDLPGHGASPLGAIAGFADLVDAVEAALQGRALGPLHLVGHSLGGAVAGALAARGTLDIRSLLLVSPAGLGAAVNGAFIAGFLRASSEASLTPWMRDLVADPNALTPAFVRATLKARQGTGLAAAQQRVAEAVFPDGTQAFSIRADLTTLAMPTRVIVGTADRIIPATQVDGLPGRIAVHRFAGIGHMPMIELRDDVLAIMREMSRSVI